MALPATADFTGTDATAIRTLTNWDGASSGSTGGACQILGNRAVAATNLVVACDWWTGDSFNANQKSSATVTALANGTYIGVAVRCSGTDNGGNVSAYIFYSDSSDGCYLEKYVGGTYSALAGPGTVFSVNDVIEISVNGTAITCKVNGTTRLSATDSSLSSGAPGICAYSNGTSTIDNWTGDNLSSAQTVSKTEAVTLSESVTVTPLSRATSATQAITLSESVTVALQSASAALSVSVSDAVTLSESRTQTVQAAGYLQPPAPALGSELLTNGGFETAGSGGADVFGTWTENAGTGTIVDETSLVHGGAHALKITAAPVSGAVNIYQSYTATVGAWYFFDMYTRGDGTNAGRYQVYGVDGGTNITVLTSTGVTGTTYTYKPVAYRVPSPDTTVRIILSAAAAASGGVTYFDDVGVKALTLASLFSTRSYATHGTTKAALTVVSGTQAGVVANLDSASSPANFVIATHDGTTAKLTKCVGGTYTELVSASATYSAGAYIEVRRLAGTNTYQLWYNGAQVGTDQTISDAGIVSNTLAGYFNTYDGNTVSGFNFVELVSVSDAATLSESVTVSVQAAGARNVNVSDSVTVSESVTVTRQAAPALSISKTESITVSEAAVTLPIAGVCVAGVLTASSNSRYFQNDSGVILLSGFHTWYTLVDGGVSDPPPVFDFDEWLDFQDARGGNTFKLWTHETAKDWPDEVDARFVPLPWARTGPGTAADGKPKFDLTTFELGYFNRLRQRAIKAGNRGYYVIVQLFQGWQADQKGLGSGDPAQYHPFAAANNINGIDGNPDDDTDILETRDASNTAVYNLQKAYVDRVIAALADLDNVMFEISNEETATATVRAWQHALVAYVQANDPMGRPVGMTWMYPNGSNSTDLYTSGADWISYGGNDSTPLASPVVWPDTGASGLVNLWDTDHMGGLVLDPPYAWKAFCRGHNVLFMDSYDGTFGDDWTADTDAEKIRYNLGYMQNYAALLDLANMTPQGALADTGYCLAKTSGSKHQYIAYQPTSGNITLDLSNTAGVLTVQWLRTGTGATSDTTVNGGASRTLTNPWSSEDAVVYLWQSTYAASVSDAVTVGESVTVSVSVQGVRSVSTSDSITVAESVAASVAAATTRSASVSDTATISETVTAAMAAALAAGVTDSATISEVVSAALSALRASASDTATVAESVSVTVQIAGLLQINVSDAVGTLDAPTLAMVLPGVSVIDTALVSEVTSATVVSPGALTIAVADSLDITETTGAAMVAALGVAVVDTVTVADVIIAYMVGLAHADWTLRDAAPWAWTLADSVNHSWVVTDRSKS